MVELPSPIFRSLSFRTGASSESLTNNLIFDAVVLTTTGSDHCKGNGKSRSQAEKEGPVPKNLMGAFKGTFETLYKTVHPCSHFLQAGTHIPPQYHNYITFCVDRKI